MIRPAVALGEIYLCTEPVDFRKQVNGLAALVQDELALDPFPSSSSPSPTVVATGCAF